jgi:hypothetical protein
MQLRIGLFQALLPHITANDGCIPVPSSRTDEIPFRPKLATPQTLFDCRDAVKNFTGRNPTATFVFDMRAAAQYASPAYPAYDQEASVCYQPVGLPVQDLLCPRLR